jgi:hypothetical protein
MNIFEWLNVWGEVVIAITLVFLLITYWILIWRINKLSKVMQKVNQIAKRWEDKLENMSGKLTYLANLASKLDIVKKGVLKLTGKTPLGDVDIDISLSKLFEEKEKKEEEKVEP